MPSLAKHINFIMLVKLFGLNKNVHIKKKKYDKDNWLQET